MSDGLFIQDPERHFEKLPQPFAFLQELVQYLVESAYERLLDTESKRAKHSNLNRLTYKPVNNVSISDDITVSDIARVKIHSEEDEFEFKHLLVLATRVHLLFFPVSCSYVTQEPLFQFKLPVEYPIQDLHVLSSSNRYSLIRCRDVNNRVEYHFATTRDSYRACSIPDEEYTVVSVTENDYHIVVTCSEGEDLFLLFFSSPIPQWRATTQAILNASDEELETNSAKLLNFTKPLLLGRINKREPIKPSNFFHQCDLPHFSDTKSYMQGISHALSQEFFKNHHKDFHDRRPGYTSTRITPTAVIIPLYTPHPHSVVSETVGKKDIIVWWEGGNDLYVYSLFAPTKDINIYPHAIMELAADFCSSSANYTGSLVALGYEGCISVWRFPHRSLLTFLTIEDKLEFSLIQYLPNSRYTQFICVTGKKNYLLSMTIQKQNLVPQQENLIPLEQPSDPALSAVTAVTQLLVSPLNHYILLQLTDGVRVLRDIAADTPVVLALLQPLAPNNTYQSTYLNTTDRHLYSIVSDEKSGSRSLVQYDLSSIINKSIIPEFEDESKPIPESAHSAKLGFTIPGDNNIKKNSVKFLTELYQDRDAIKKRADQAWKELEKHIPLPPGRTPPP